MKTEAGVRGGTPEAAAGGGEAGSVLPRADRIWSLGTKVMSDLWPRSCKRRHFCCFKPHRPTPTMVSGQFLHLLLPTPPSVPLPRAGTVSPVPLT